MARAIRPGGALALVAGAGVLAGLAVLTMPVGLLETVVASVGLGEVVPAAAPPLGMTARAIVAGFAALMTAGVAAWLHWPTEFERRAREDRRQGVGIMGFAFSKLTALARGRSGADEPPAPSQRRADAHPDAPPRPPIFASRDFDGVDIFPRSPLPRHAASGPDVEQDESGDLPFAPPSAAYDIDAPVPSFVRGEAVDPWPVVGNDTEEDTVDVNGRAGPETFPDPASASPVEVSPEPVVVPMVADADHAPSIAELTARLERGLAKRARAVLPTPGSGGVIADMPIAEAQPVRPSVPADADAALRAALGALRTMADRRR